MKTYLGLAMFAGFALAAVTVQGVLPQATSGPAFRGQYPQAAPPVNQSPPETQKVFPLGVDQPFANANFGSCGDGTTNKCISWPQVIAFNNCFIRDTKITLRPNGTVSWRAVIRSNSFFGGDSYGTLLSFRDVNNTPVFNFPWFYQDVDKNDRDWIRDNLGVPAIFFDHITQLARTDHC
jgi:hypothetical protein